MTQCRVAVVVGSLRRESINRKLASAMAGLAPAELSLEQVRLDDLPLYNQDDDDSPAIEVTRLKDEIARADALLFVTPEYNRSIPGVLKNAIDHASRPYGQSVWAGKPAGVIGASTGGPATSMAQQHLRNVLAYLDVPTLGQPEAFVRVQDGTFDDDGGLADDRTRAFLQTWMDRYVEWVSRFR